MTPVGLLALAAVLAGPVPHWLAAARWPLAAPAPALLLWQAVGLGAGLAGVTAGLLYAATGDHPLRWVAGVLSGLLLARLLWSTATVTVRTLGQRRRQRTALDLVALPLAAVPGGRLLPSPMALAYGVPGLRPRVVLTEGAVDRLGPDHLRAVLAHERAHLTQRHDLVVLPFAAWSAALPWLPATRRARAAVELLVEALADDSARARVGAGALATALRRLGGDDPLTETRLRRLDRLRPMAMKGGGT